jgi:hypothetical protein
MLYSSCPRAINNFLAAFPTALFAPNHQQLPSCVPPPIQHFWLRKWWTCALSFNMSFRFCPNWFCSILRVQWKGGPGGSKPIAVCPAWQAILSIFCKLNCLMNFSIAVAALLFSYRWYRNIVTCNQMINSYFVFTKVCALPNYVEWFGVFSNTRVDPTEISACSISWNHLM